MDYSNKQHALAYLLTAVFCAFSFAEDRCGHFDAEPAACNKDCMALLDGDFKSLLRSASGEKQTPTCELATPSSSNTLKPVCRAQATRPPLAQVASPNLYAPEETTATRHLLPRVANKPAPPTPVTKTCVLKDETTAQRVLTLKIPGNVRAEAISPEELSARQVAETSLKRLPAEKTAENLAHNYVAPTGAQPSLRIGSGSTPGSIKVDAHNVDVCELLDVLSNESGIAILANPRLEGTISSTTEAESVVVLIRTMLEPFSYSVVPTKEALIVCGPNESAETVLAACMAATQPEQVVVDEIPKPVPQRTEVPAIPSKDIQLASAEIPEQKISRPLPLRKPQRSPEAIAVDRIVRVAQDAFATDQPEYATQVLAQGIKRFPKAHELKTMLGEMHYLQGSYDQATVVLAKVLTQQKRNSMANEIMGRSLAALGQKQRAQHYLLQAKEYRSAGH